MLNFKEKLITIWFDNYAFTKIKCSICELLVGIQHGDGRVFGLESDENIFELI